MSSGVFSHPLMCLTHNLIFMSVSFYVERMELWMAGRMPKGSGCNNGYQTLGPIGLRSSRERMTSDPCTLVGQLSLSLPPRSLLGLHLLSSSLLSSPAPFIRQLPAHQSHPSFSVLLTQPTNHVYTQEKAGCRGGGGASGSAQRRE